MEYFQYYDERRERPLTTNRGIIAHLSTISVVGSCCGLAQCYQLMCCCWQNCERCCLCCPSYLPTTSTRPAVVTVLRCLLCDESSSPTASVVSQGTQYCTAVNTTQSKATQSLLPPAAPTFITKSSEWCVLGVGGNTDLVLIR